MGVSLEPLEDRQYLYAFPNLVKDRFSNQLRQAIKKGEE